MIRMPNWICLAGKSIITDSVSPTYICPMVTRHDGQLEIVAPSEEDVDPKMACMGEPILGMYNTTWEKGDGPGAIPPRP